MGTSVSCRSPPKNLAIHIERQRLPVNSTRKHRSRRLDRLKKGFLRTSLQYVREEFTGIYERLLMAESGRSELSRECPLTTQSGRSSNRRNGDECSLPDDCNTQLADSCSAQRYFRFVPIRDICQNESACEESQIRWGTLCGKARGCVLSSSSPWSPSPAADRRTQVQGVT